jgi:hypothetical protein
LKLSDLHVIMSLLNLTLNVVCVTLAKIFFLPKYMFFTQLNLPMIDVASTLAVSKTKAPRPRNICLVQYLVLQSRDPSSEV